MVMCLQFRTGDGQLQWTVSDDDEEIPDFVAIVEIDFDPSLR
jgi:hypothetical protein